MEDPENSLEPLNTNLTSDVELPAEMWYKIFSNVDHVDDAKNWSLVCKKFHEIVGKSEAALNLLVLRLHADMKKDVQNKLLESQRNYKKIQLHYFDRILKLSEFSKKFCAFMTKLEIIKCYLTEKELIEVLMLSRHNLENLSIRRTKIEKNAEFTHESFKLEKLKGLEVQNVNCDVFRILSDMLPDTLVHICFECFNSFEIGSSFAEVVQKQKNLKNLNIVLSESSAFDDIDLDEMHALKLEKLLILSNNSFEEVNENIVGFIKSQRASLKVLSLLNVPLANCLEIFKFLPNLEELEIGKRSYCASFKSGKNFRIPSLKFLVYAFQFSDASLSNYSNLIKRFTNVNVTAVSLRYKPNSVLLQLINEAHPNLKTIDINEFNDNAFQYVIFSKVEELVITGTTILLINMDFIFFALPNLKILSLQSKVQINSRALVWILGNFTKLEKLEIENARQLRNLSNLSHHFKNLKFLYITNYTRGDIEEFRQKLRQFPDLKFFRLTLQHPPPEFNYFNFSDDEDSDDATDDDGDMSD